MVRGRTVQMRGGQSERLSSMMKRNQIPHGIERREGTLSAPVKIRAGFGAICLNG
jgi:hypothetical protein